MGPRDGAFAPPEDDSSGAEDAVTDLAKEYRPAGARE